ncbi:MAG: hypothetical protein JSR80_00390, partial [Verrucomicrobia bacterium]|nr:hypothetical protein [Verrucomicrobiota bacterium]
MALVKGRHVLLYLHSPHLRETVPRVLKQAGYEFSMVENEAEYRACLGSHDIDFIMSDYKVDLDVERGIVKRRFRGQVEMIPFLFIGEEKDLPTPACMRLSEEIQPDALLHLIHKIEEEAQQKNQNYQGKRGFYREHTLLGAVKRKMHRMKRGEETGALAVLSLSEMPSLVQEYGPTLEKLLTFNVLSLIEADGANDELVGYLGNGVFLLFCPNLQGAEVFQRLTQLRRRLILFRFALYNRFLFLTPHIGFAPLKSGASSEDLRSEAFAAMDLAIVEDAPMPVAYQSHMRSMAASRRIPAV